MSYYVVEANNGKPYRVKQAAPPQTDTQRQKDGRRQGGIVAAFALSEDQNRWTLDELAMAYEFNILTPSTTKAL